MAKKRKVSKTGAVWKLSSEEATLAQNPRYNGFIVGHGRMLTRRSTAANPSMVIILNKVYIGDKKEVALQCPCCGSWNVRYVLENRKDPYLLKKVTCLDCDNFTEDKYIMAFYWFNFDDWLFNVWQKGHTFGEKRNV